MLDAHLHQGAGLLGFMPRNGLRVLAAASDERTPESLDMLWQACAALQRFGYPVMVLDGTTEETETAPGLLQLLSQPPWADAAHQFVPDVTSLAVLPAAIGLQQLARSAPPHLSPLQPLLPCFRAYAVLVVVAPAHVLASALQHTDITALVTMHPGAKAVVHSYQVLKQMALAAGTPCLVAALTPTGEPARQQAVDALRALQLCAQRHLDTQVHTTVIRNGHAPDSQRLALQLLENAGTIDGALPTSRLNPTAASPEYSIRSH